MTINITGGGAFVADTGNESYVMDADATIGAASGLEGIDASASLGGRSFRLDGTIVVSGGATALFIDNDVSADADKVFIGRSAALKPNLFGGGASGGIEVVGGTVEIENLGVVSSGKAGIRATLERFTLDNLGLVNSSSGIAAITSASDDTSITNSGSILAGDANAIDVTGRFEIDNAGLIQSKDEVAIRVGHVEEASGTIVNTGTITGGSKAIVAESEASDIRVVNRGNVIGNIDLSLAGGASKVDISGGFVGGSIVTGAGDDILLLRNATILGVADGGDGDDTYVVDDETAPIVEAAGEGSDTVRAFTDFSLGDLDDVENVTLLGRRNTDAKGNAADNRLTGNKGANAIDGDAGDDTIRGAKGNDELSGGDDADTFVFRSGDRNDRITDFTLADDVIDLSGVTAIRNFAVLSRNHVSESGGDVIIDAGNGDRLRIENLALSDLDDDLFLF